MIVRIFLKDKKLIVTKKTEKEFKDAFGGPYELVQTVKDETNAEISAKKLLTFYRGCTIEFDSVIKQKWGWKYFTEELKEFVRKRLKDTKIGVRRDQATKLKISFSRRGKGNFKGKRHTPISKMIIAEKRIGKSRVTGLRWAHEPYTGKEIRTLTLPQGYFWGRNPEFKDWISKEGT